MTNTVAAAQAMLLSAGIESELDSDGDIRITHICQMEGVPLPEVPAVIEADIVDESLVTVRALLGEEFLNAANIHGAVTVQRALRIYVIPRSDRVVFQIYPMLISDPKSAQGRKRFPPVLDSIEIDLLPLKWQLEEVAAKWPGMILTNDGRGLVSVLGLYPLNSKQLVEVTQALGTLGIELFENTMRGQLRFVVHRQIFS